LLYNLYFLNKKASKRERRQYQKKSDKPTKTPAKVAAELTLACLDKKNINLQQTSSTATTTYTVASSITPSPFSSSSPSVSSSSSSSSSSPKSVVNKLNYKKKYNIKNVIMKNESTFNLEHDMFHSNNSNSSMNSDSIKDDSESNEFLKSLSKIENEFAERLQNEMEQNGLIKRLINFNYTEEYKLDVLPVCPSTIKILKQLIVDLIDSKCKSLILWARYVPDFNQLSIEDQTCSIEFNFLEVILIDCIWHSMFSFDNSNLSDSKSPNIKLVLHQNLSLSRTFCKQLNLIDIYDHFFSIVVKLCKMQITFEEYLCLKAIALFKSDYGFSNVTKIEELRRKCFRALKVATINADKISWSYRYDSLLLLLADIKSISVRLMHFIITFHSDPKKLPNLLYDMFMSQKIFGLACPNEENISPKSCVSDSFMDVETINYRQHNDSKCLKIRTNQNESEENEPINTEKDTQSPESISLSGYTENNAG
jgi:hypothetical protein